HGGDGEYSNCGGDGRSEWWHWLLWENSSKLFTAINGGRGGDGGNRVKNVITENNTLSVDDTDTGLLFSILSISNYSLFAPVLLVLERAQLFHYLDLDLQTLNCHIMPQFCP
ncbi:18294_t:CDS:2, partial [Racocetra persica]